MSEALKRRALPYYESRGATIRPGDYIAGDLATGDGLITFFRGHVRSMAAWSDGTYLYLTDETVRIPARQFSVLTLALHQRRGIMPTPESVIRATQ